MVVPVWSKLPEPAASLQNLMKCGCKKKDPEKFANVIRQTFPALSYVPAMMNMRGKSNNY